MHKREICGTAVKEKMGLVVHVNNGAASLLSHAQLIVALLTVEFQCITYKLPNIKIKLPYILTLQCVPALAMCSLHCKTPHRYMVIQRRTS